MRRLWLIFAQTVTVSLAVVFVVSTLRPEWLGRGNAPSVIALHEAPSNGDNTPPPGTHPNKWHQTPQNPQNKDTA